MPLTKQFCAMYAQRVCRELLTRTIRKFLSVSEECPLITINSVIIEKISAKSRQVSAVRLSTSIDGRFLCINFA